MLSNIHGLLNFSKLVMRATTVTHQIHVKKLLKFEVLDLFHPLVLLEGVDVYGYEYILTNI